MMAAAQQGNMRPPGGMPVSMPGGMMGSQGPGGMMASQGIMGSQGALSGRSVTPLSSHMGVQQSQMNPGFIAHDNIGQRVQDLDQRLTLTEHANRAALDEVYGLRYV